MNLMNDVSFFNLIPAGVRKNNAAFTSYVLDVAALIAQGAKGIMFLVQMGATDIAMSTLKVQEAEATSNSTTLTSATDVHDFTVKPSATDDNGLFGVYVPLNGKRKRYLQLAATAGSGTAGIYMSAVAIIDRPNDGSGSAASLNLTDLEIHTA